jgi:hypothetical protein
MRVFGYAVADRCYREQQVGSMVGWYVTRVAAPSGGFTSSFAGL